jgi:hypothetical protein
LTERQLHSLQLREKLFAKNENDGFLASSKVFSVHDYTCI